MYAGILRVHDVSRCAPLRKILKAPVTAPKKIAAHYLQKKTPLSFDIGKTTVLHTASLRLCRFFWRDTFVQKSEQSCGVSSGAAKQGTFATRESFSIF